MDFKKQIIKLLTKNTTLKEEELENLITVPPNPQMGDYAFPCFRLGKNPKEAAEKLKQKIRLPKIISKAEVIGPYLNFFVNHHAFAETSLKKIYERKEKYGKQNIGQGKIIAMDYSHPNIAKPFGIGHLRSTVIGNSLYRILSLLGYKPISINHLGDWGTQFGKLIVAFRMWGKEKEMEKEPIKYLLSLYVRFHEEAEKKDSLNDEARAAFKKIEEGDKECTKLWEKFRKLSLKDFQKIYDLLDVSFDSYKGEADMVKFWPAVFKKLEKKVDTEVSEGALITKLEKYKMPPVILLKSDGATTYHSRDIATASYRIKELKADTLLYIVGMEQKLYFQQLFKVLGLMGYKKEFVHADFGHFRFGGKKMSTRKGRVVFLEETLSKSIELAKKIILEKNPKLKNKEEVAKMVGVGAIIFGDLSNDRVRNIDFDWDRMLSFEGETAPYIQYTHARACSILRKAQKEHKVAATSEVSYELYNIAEEKAVIRLLYDFPDVLVKVADSYKPHHLAHYLIALAQTFNEFYHKCPVISEVKEQMQARLLLVDCVRQVLQNGLGLLGIKSPEEM